MGVKEIGFAPLALTAEGRDSPLAALGDVPVLHWHGDQFGIPPGAQCTAGTATCPHQGFALGPRCSACNATWRPTRAPSSAGWSAMPASWPRRASIRAPCAPRPGAAGAPAAAAGAVFTRWLDGLEPRP